MMRLKKSAAIACCLAAALLLALSCRHAGTGNAGSTSVPEPPPDTPRHVLFTENLPEPAGYVSDYGALFSAAEEDSLSALIKAFEQRTTIEVALVTFDTAVPTADSAEALTRRIAAYWGVGRNGKDNGITIGIAAHLRHMRIVNGDGITKVLSNAATKRIIDTAFAPRYKEGRYYDGTRAGLLALMAALERR